ncbi:protein phosphatase 1 regulatory subunit 15B [Sorex fumeus]|uniref:protein phosphatase 1 regulatory subunit 15B n=1 Tax=Sorex fumeus TaxID=62283 RepID=UPI0024AD823B|nr:protein phosphatase 1 regulatory subunit 15B [Sorex fumeus]
MEEPGAGPRTRPGGWGLPRFLRRRPAPRAPAAAPQPEAPGRAWLRRLGQLLAPLPGLLQRLLLWTQLLGGLLPARWLDLAGGSVARRGLRARADPAAPSAPKTPRPDAAAVAAAAPAACALDWLEQGLPWPCRAPRLDLELKAPGPARAPAAPASLLEPRLWGVELLAGLLAERDPGSPPAGPPRVSVVSYLLSPAYLDGLPRGGPRYRGGGPGPWQPLGPAGSSKSSSGGGSSSCRRAPLEPARAAASPPACPPPTREGLPEIQHLRMKRLEFLQQARRPPAPPALPTLPTLPTPEQDHGYHSLEEEHGLLRVDLKRGGQSPAAGATSGTALVPVARAQLLTEEPPPPPAVGKPGPAATWPADAPPMAEGAAPPGPADEPPRVAAARPACSNPLIDYILGGAPADADAGSESDGSEDWSEDDGFDSDGDSDGDSDSDSSSSEANPGPGLQLWDSFHSGDPYDPRNFTAALRTRARPGPGQPADPRGDPRPGGDDDDDGGGGGDGESSADEAESLRLWNSFCRSDDPYNLFNFKAPFQTAGKSWKGFGDAAGGPASFVAVSERRTVLSCKVRLVGSPEGACAGLRQSVLGQGHSPARRKKVTFLEEVTEYYISGDEDRKGPWEEFARDGCRFQKRIQETEHAIGYCLTFEHREKMFNRLQETCFQGLVFKQC